MTPVARAKPRPLIVATLLLGLALAGCTSVESGMDCSTDAPVEWHDIPAPIDASAGPCQAYAGMGFDGQTWPDLSGHELIILDHGAFDWAFAEAKPLFENLTGAKVTNVAADDAGSALQLAISDLQAGGGSYDILYGVDNAYMGRAVDAGVFAPYTPVLADRVAEDYRFVPTQDGAWLATPVDHGYIAINSDPRKVEPVPDLDDLAARAQDVVVSDPRFSSPGLGFLVTTVAVYGEDGYLGYWQRLFDNGVTVTTGWTEAYVYHFSGGYGQYDEKNLGDKAIVLSYTTSPAYELAAGGSVLNDVLRAPQSTFHQIQTMGILHGADRVAAEAWIEFTLTNDFQALAAPMNVIYPVVENEATAASVQEAYHGEDPEPGSFEPAGISAKQLGDDVERWVHDWVALYEAQ